MPIATIGSLIRERRTQAKYSQMHLALDVGISARHLGFVELGRAAPSARLLIRLANHLDLPLRERNEWLLAAGYAPRYVETLLSGPELARVRCSLQSLLDAHDPYPGVAVDRAWTVQLANQGARDLFGTFPPSIGGTPINIFRLALHPDGFGRPTKHFARWSSYLLRQLDLLASRYPDVTPLADEIAAWPDLPPRDTWRRIQEEANYSYEPVLTWEAKINGQELVMYTMMSSFGTPSDITLSELTLELFFPADEHTETALRSRSTRRGFPLTGAR
jgi:transcriptional regulator with XRE-family HTH domain